MSIPAAQPARSLLPIYLLSAAGFTILTTEFVIVGVLPPMAGDLRVNVAQAGLLVTLFAVTVVTFGPLLTAYATRLERKPVFVSILLLFALSNALAASAPNVPVMAVARFIPALGLPVFWALASETGMRIMGPAQTGRAISLINSGIVAATIFGIPVGTLISDRFGWRTAFGAFAALALIKAVALLVWLPATPVDRERVPVGRQLGVLREPRVLGHVGLSVLVYAGMFTGYTYLADILEKLGGFNQAWVGWTLMAFGGMGLVGNALGGRLADRHPLSASIGFCLPLTTALWLLIPALGSPVGLVAVLAVWGICHAALFTVSHTRVMKATARTPALGASLNVSGANLGIALGALLGSRVIGSVGLGGIGVAAAAVVALAIVAAGSGLAAKPQNILSAS